MNYSDPIVVAGSVVAINIAYDVIKRFLIKKDSLYAIFEGKLEKKADKKELELLEKSLKDFKERIGKEIHETTKKIVVLEKYMIAIMEKLNIDTLKLIEK